MGGPSRRSLLAAALAAPWRVQAEGLVRETRELFGSPCQLLAPRPVAGALSCWARLGELNAQWNAWKPGTLGRVNDALRAGRWAEPPADLAALLRLAQRAERDSAGLFNAGLGALVGAWGFHADRLDERPAPAAAWLQRWRAAPPSLALLEWRAGRVRSTHPALQLDLGGIAKGWALDEALDTLQRQGVRDALLDLGGNLAAFGQGADGPWRIGLRNPFGAGLLATLQTQGREAVVTSGTYERWRRLPDGRLATHVLDPAAAQPAQALASVTVVHASAAWADAAATALLAAGPARWQALAARLGLDQVLVVGADGRARAHGRLAQRLTFVDEAVQRDLRIV
ncbi:MAG: FAD:protein FMN transferase [Piscinibacter sp.]|uniref:FAD:protein FMN transferase n=1 Tax=Piscinibacter sp. TaxID=1903157 RepID=UPI0025879D8E|nr:FAD:protein FMN transferase [Piscinibacter sp.]MCW5666204.1 FAD:protein FMN transferase [Piscinibacter sp.]